MKKRRKARAKEDNIRKYIQREIKLTTSGYHPIIKKVESLKPQQYDLLLLTDLILGTVYNKLTRNPLKTKVKVRETAEKWFGNKIRFWEWKFTKK